MTQTRPGLPAALAFAGLCLLLSASAAAASAVPPPGGTLLERGQSLLGLLVLVALAWAIGYVRNRQRTIPRRAVGWGLGLMAAFTLIVFWLPTLLTTVNDVINALLGFTKAGARVVFGDLSGFTLPVRVTDPDGNTLSGVAEHGAYFAFFVLPTIIFFSALTAVLYHIGIMQYVVQALAWVMSKSMKTSGAETLSAAANIFVGQTEAPLMVKPFMRSATHSELMAIMVAGFANIASVGIQVGGIASIVPERRTDLARLGLLAMVGGGIATLMAAAMVGIIA